MHLPTRRRPGLALRSGSARRALGLLAALGLVAGLAATSVPAAHAADPTFCADSQPYAPVDEVEAFAPGTAVTGLTVTSGTSPSGFTGTYVGYIDNGISTGRDMLLFKLSSPVIDGTAGLKPAGIWAGMSGSPVYDEQGRLIGAVAYSLNYDNLPIAGVTPAEYMKTIGTTAVGTTNRVRVTPSNLKVSDAGIAAAGTALVGRSFSPVRTVNVAGGAGAKENAFVNRILARTPRTARAAATLRSGSFVPAAAVSPNAVPEPLVAGGTVAALYATGDLVTGAVGTVTAICGDTVWAFGHPMDAIGRTSLLLANASTALIVPDATGRYGSYKQVSAFGPALGMVTQDRLAGIRGTVMTPTVTGIEVDVQNPAGKSVRRYHGDLAFPELTASAVAYLVGEAAIEQLDQYGAGTGELTWTIDMERADGTRQSLTNTQVVADAAYFPDVIGTPPALDAWQITSNTVEDVKITGVQVALRLLDDDAVSYKPAGMQVQLNGTWKRLAGARLKPGGSYLMHPQYTKLVNDRVDGTTVNGSDVAVKLSTRARRSGSFVVASVTDASPECDVDADGFVTCTDWSGAAEEGDGSDGPTYADFDELLAALEGLVPANAVEGLLRYRLTRGTRMSLFDWTAPGVITGSLRSRFSIR